MSIKPKCTACKNELSQELINVIAEGTRVKLLLGDLVRDMNSDDFMCVECFHKHNPCNKEN